MPIKKTSQIPEEIPKEEKPKRRSSTRTKKGTIRKKPGKKAKPGVKPMNRDKVLESLKKFLQLDLSVDRACSAYNAGEYDKAIIEKRKPKFISKSTVYGWMNEDEEFRSKIEFYRDTPNVLARQTWREKIAKGDYQAAKDWLERKEKSEFSLKTEVGITDKDGNDVIDKVSIHILTVPQNGAKDNGVTALPKELPEGEADHDQ